MDYEPHIRRFTTINDNEIIHTLADKYDINKIMGCPIIPQFHWCIANLKKDGVTAIGTGESFTESIAAIRAVGEVLERWAIMNKSIIWKQLVVDCPDNPAIKSPKHSNGIAFHGNLGLALKAAFRELVEREVILNSWFYREQIFKISGMSSWLILSRLNAIRFGLSTHFLYIPNQFCHIVVCVLEGKQQKPHLIFGFGTSFDKIENAIEKAFMECWRFFWGYFQNNEKLLTPIKREEVKNCIDHYHFYSNNFIDLQSVFSYSRNISLKSLVNKQFAYNDCSAICNFVDSVKYVDLAEYQMAGYVVWICKSTFHKFFTGQLSTAKGLRNVGEVHPIA